MKRFSFFLVASVLILSCVFISSCNYKSHKKDAPKELKIAFASFGPDAGADMAIQGYLSDLKENGFVLGKNLEIIKISAGGDAGNIPRMLRNADIKGYDFIVPLSTPCLSAAISSIKKTKIVFCYVYDPILAGAGRSFRNHLPNITGIGSLPPVEETIDFIKRIFPRARRIGFIYNPNEANSRKVISLSKGSLADNEMGLVTATINDTGEIGDVTRSLLKKGIDVLWVSGDNTALQGFTQISEATEKAKVPIITNNPEYVHQGALAAIGVGWFQAGEAASRLSVRIIKGENPKDIPFENVAVKRVVLNKELARQMRIKFPQSVLQEAELSKKYSLGILK